MSRCECDNGSACPVHQSHLFCDTCGEELSPCERCGDEQCASCEDVVEGLCRSCVREDSRERDDRCACCAVVLAPNELGRMACSRCAGSSVGSGSTTAPSNPVVKFGPAVVGTKQVMPGLYVVERSTSIFAQAGARAENTGTTGTTGVAPEKRLKCS